MYSSSKYSIETTHSHIIEVFFMISGFLTFHSGILPMAKAGWVYIFIRVLSRWMRMIPVFVILMLFIIFVLPYTNEGPLWDYKIANEVTNCKASFWTSVLAVNNIFRADQSCMVFSWYIAVDVQLAVVGGVLLYIFTKNNKIGILAILLSFVTSAFMIFTVVYVNNYHGLMRFYISFLEDPRKEKEFINFYIATYTRILAYSMGIISCMLIKIMKRKQIRFTDKQTYLIFLSFLVIGEGGQYYGRLFYVFDREYDRLENALYATMSRMIFVSIYIVFLCLFYASGFGIFTAFVKWNGWTVLGRLTYSVFLVNTVIQLYHTSSQQQTASFPSRMNLLWWTCGDIVWSYAIGFILYLCAEAPISNLTKLLQNKLMKILVKPKTHECVEKINFNLDNGAGNLKNE